MRNNELIPTAYENILTGTNLTNWRKLGKEQQQVIIDALNKEWNKKAQNKVEEMKK
jgi:hypothetical protein